MTNARWTRHSWTGSSHSVPDMWDLPDGTKAHVIVHTAPVFNEEGKITEVLEMAVDVDCHGKASGGTEETGGAVQGSSRKCALLPDSGRSFLSLGFLQQMFFRDFGSKMGRKVLRGL